MGFFTGGQDTSLLQRGYQRSQDYYRQLQEQADQPGARQLATNLAFQQALERQRAQTAGQGGQAAALSQQRTLQMAPLMAAKSAEAGAAARAGDVEAQRAAEERAMAQMGADERALFEAAERKRQEEQAFRRNVASGLLDVGTKAVGGLV